MAEIGKSNRLKVVKLVDFGAYLDGGNNVEILLPSRYISSPIQIDDEINVFIYTDSEDRLIATTDIPLIKVGEFAYLKVKQVNRVGVFMDWGLPKDLLAPFNEQRTKMLEGCEYLVYAYLDDTTKRIVASSKIEKFLGNKIPEYKKGEQVEILVYQSTEIGFKVIVDNAFYGMLYHNELFSVLNIGDRRFAYIKRVREDGKIDLTLSDRTETRVSVLAEQIYSWLEINGGKSTISDKSEPEEIKRLFECSKKDFKKAVGLLYKEKRISITNEGINTVI